MALAHDGRIAGLVRGRVDRPDRAAAVVGEQVRADECGKRGSAIDDAAGHGAAERVGILRHRRRQPVDRAERAGREAVKSLHPVPAEVLAAATAGAHDVDLLEGVLPHVADPQVVGRPVERDPPRVAEAGDVDLGPRAGCSEERIVGWDAVGTPVRRMVDVDSEDLAEERRQLLAVALRVAAAAAVAEGDVEVTIRPEHDVAAIVVGVGLVDGQDDALAIGVRLVGVAGRHAPLRHDRGAIGVGVVGVEARVARIARMEGEAQQALLPAVAHLRANVEERARGPLAAGNDPDRTALVDDEQPAAAVAPSDDIERIAGDGDD